MNGKQLYLPMFMPIVRFKIIRKGMGVYDNSEEVRTYWEKRSYMNSLDSIFSVRVERLYKRQHGLCPICRREITGEQIRDSELHEHHLTPTMVSGNNKLSNLRLIHNDCHIELHRILSIEDMAFLASQNIDYCDKDYLYETYV